MYYTIEIDYDTGGSLDNEFGVKDKIGATWGNYDLAREALEKIKDHYEIYKKLSGSFRNREYKPPEGYNEYFLIIELDDGSLQQISCFWCGYFEKLNSAKIVIESDEYIP